MPSRHAGARGVASTSSDSRHAIIHAEIITPTTTIHDGAVVWSGATIERVGATAACADLLPRCEDTTDGTGCLVVPGLIDIHLHGAMGHDVSDASPEAIQTVSRFLVKHGTTAFLAAAVYDPAALQTLHDVARSGAEGASLLGVYLEGPFINPAKRGGVPAAAIRPPSERLLKEILQAYRGSLRMMTVAPEIPDALPLIPMLLRAGVIPALGHSDATLAVALEAERHGARHLTHLFNAMSGLHHREPGLAALLAASDEITAEITADGVHVHPTMLRVAMRMAGHPMRLALITDSVRPTGLPDGDYTHLGRPMRLTGTRAALLDGTLVGSVITLRQAITNAVRDGGVPLADAVYMSTLLPATILGIQREYGHLDAGARADLLLLGQQFSVESVYVGGTLRYRRARS